VRTLQIIFSWLNPPDFLIIHVYFSDVKISNVLRMKQMYSTNQGKESINQLPVVFSIWQDKMDNTPIVEPGEKLV
jgi:hypothetical protein